MNLSSIPSISATLVSGGTTGTLSAKPAAMHGNALPFRLQLEASTAPLATLAAAPPGAAGFVMPDAVSEGLDSAIMGKNDPSAHTGDGSQDPETDEVAVPVLPLIFDLPHYAALAAGIPVAASAPGTTGSDFAADVPSASAGLDTTLAVRSQAAAPLQAGTAHGSAGTAKNAEPSATSILPSTPGSYIPGGVSAAASGSGSEALASDLAPADTSTPGAPRPAPQAGLGTGPHAVQPDLDAPAIRQSVDQPAETAVAAAGDPAVPQGIDPAIERRFLQRRPSVVPGTDRRFENPVGGPADGNALARIGALPTEPRVSVSDDSASVNGGTGQTATITQTTSSLPLQATDPALSQMQNMAGPLGQQTPAPTTPSQPGGTNAATPFAPAAPIPFDRQFGQRVGSAIGSAMNAMSLKDGMLLLQISPERLGKIEIMIDPGSDRLQITTENEAVRGAIAQAHGRIEQELRAAGQRIGSIDVETRDTASSGQTGQQQAGAQQQQRGGENAAQQALGQQAGTRTLPQDRSTDLSPAMPTPAATASAKIFYA